MVLKVINRRIVVNTIRINSCGLLMRSHKQDYHCSPHAGTRRSDQWPVQLSVARAARASGPSAPRDPSDDGPGLRLAVVPVREDVLGHRPAVDSAGAVAAGVADSVALYGPQRAAPDG